MRRDPRSPLRQRLLISNPIGVQTKPQFIVAEATEPALAATLDSRLRADLSRRHV